MILSLILQGLFPPT